MIEVRQEHSPLDVEAKLPYLARDILYTKEKPYNADYVVEGKFEDVKPTNHIYDYRPVLIRDARHDRNRFSLERNGFCFLKATTSISASSAVDARTPAVDQFLGEIEVLLTREFPEYTRIEVLEFLVRKRAQEFPNKIGARVDTEQPATLPHADYSVPGAFMRMNFAFPGQEQHYADKDFDFLNVWRVLKGPNDDWPLALCDSQSIDWDDDAVPNDALHRTRLSENMLLHYNESHKWYYLSAQETSDILVFRHMNSKGQQSCAFHCAFENPLATSKPRESIEVRVVAFR